MKFLIINPSSGQDVAPASSPEATRQYSEKIQSLLSAGQIERAWVLHAGGHAYVINAAGAEELAGKLKVNALHHSNGTQIIPVFDAVDYLSNKSTTSD